MTIKRCGKGKREWCLYTADGTRKLGQHATKAKAQAQERAIWASKSKKKGQRKSAKPKR